MKDFKKCIKLSIDHYNKTSDKLYDFNSDEHKWVANYRSKNRVSFELAVTIGWIISIWKMFNKFLQLAIRIHSNSAISETESIWLYKYKDKHRLLALLADRLAWLVTLNR